MVSNLNQSLLAMPMAPQNFVSLLSAKIAVTGTSSMVTFTGLTGMQRTTFKITNKGSNGAYVAAGMTSATAVVSAVGVALPGCDYVGAGAILTQDYQGATGIIDTIAAVGDGGTTTLEVSMGYGQ